MTDITTDLIIKAYAAGVFPMGESRSDDGLFWIDPERRGILPLDRFHLSRRLRRTVRSGRFQVTVDRAFDQVIRHCAQTRPESWINRQIERLYGDLHRRRLGHSVEVWREELLVGGLYGMALGAAFFGESMFSLERDSSKVALVHLVGRLRRGGFELLDTQFVTEHLARFGAIEIPRHEYHERLARALQRTADFYCGGEELSVDAVLQSITQTS